MTGDRGSGPAADLAPFPVSAATQVFDLPRGLELESGERLAPLRVAYRTWGSLDASGSNAVLVCHALTGGADVDTWWPELLGEGRAFDPAQDFVIASNVLGGCYGTTGPASERPDGGPSPAGRWANRWGRDFPDVTIRDMVRLQAELLSHLGVERLALVIGGSMGGMQALEWAAMFPERVAALAPLCVSARHSPWCIGLSRAQRRAIEADPAWRGGVYPPEDPPAEGLAVARMIAQCTYRSWESFERFGRDQRRPGYFEAESYLDYQGNKLVGRFDANSYLTLTRSMDSHDLGRGRGSVAAALAAIQQPALVVSVDSDLLYPPREQEELAAGMPRAELAVLSSLHGHDGFLTEGAVLGERLRRFRARLRDRSAA
ncbi:MAG: homoserine O-acetyltransferase [Acidobacteriota bacterium]